MTNIIFHLYQLQKIDSRRDLINSRLDVIRNVFDEDHRVAVSQGIVSILNQELLNLRTELSEIEEIISVKRIKLEQSEASLYGGTVKNPKELQDLQKEILSIKTNILLQEDRQLAKLIEIENKEKEISSANNNLALVTVEVNKENAELTSEMKLLESEIKRLRFESSAITDQISSEYLKRYEDLRKKKKGVAISQVEDQSCSVCGSTLTPAECQNAKVPNSFVYCGSCGRLLYAG